MLSAEAIQEFQTLYLNHYGQDLSDSEAKKKSEALLSLYRVVFTPKTMKMEKNYDNAKTKKHPN